MEGAVAHGAVSEERNCDPILFSQFEAVTGADGLQNAGPHDPAGAHYADFGSEQMHASAAPPRATGDASVELGEERLRRQPFGQRVSVTAMRAEHDVVGTQVGADAHGNRLLADAGVASAVDEPLLM